jgi:hypothetical protein
MKTQGGIYRGIVLYFIVDSLLLTISKVSSYISTILNLDYLFNLITCILLYIVVIILSFKYIHLINKINLIILLFFIIIRFIPYPDPAHTNLELGKFLQYDKFLHYISLFSLTIIAYSKLYLAEKKHSSSL